MTKRKLTRQIVLYEVLGVGAIILAAWLNEMLDLPHRLLGVAPTPVNWAACLFVSIAGVALALVVVMLTRRLIGRVKYLEGFLLFCAGCKRVRVEGVWLPVDVYVRRNSAADVTHGLCPECLTEYSGDWDDGLARPDRLVVLQDCAEHADEDATVPAGTAP